MTDQHYLNINQLNKFAPQSPILAFRPNDNGSPQQDWCSHLQKYPHYRRELEEFAVMNDMVLRIADGEEAAPIERVKILSLEYAVKTLGDEIDGKEFVRAVRAIASPDAGQWELEQIASYYYSKIRKSSKEEVLKEMGLLGMQLEAVTATIAATEVEHFEFKCDGHKLSVADQRPLRLAQKNLAPLPPRTPNFDDEFNAVLSRCISSKTTRLINDDFANFYLDDEGKSIEDLDADFESFEKLEQYDENGIVGFSMSDAQHAVVAYEFSSEVDASYLPLYVRPMAKEMNLIFVGHEIGGSAAQDARRFVLENRVLANEIRAAKKGFSSPATNIPSANQFSSLPFSNEDFSEWLAAKLDHHFPNRTLRNVRRIVPNNAGMSCEFSAVQEVNPDFEEMQYVSGVCNILWNQLKADFHMRSLRRSDYQRFHIAIRRSKDTAEVAQLKKEAYQDFKELRKLSLKEFTALNTAAKSQEARLAKNLSPFARKTQREINAASINRIRFLKYFLYNDSQIQSLSRQEKQALWDAIRTRETSLQTVNTNQLNRSTKSVRPSLFQQSSIQKQVVRVTPNAV